MNPIRIIRQQLLPIACVLGLSQPTDAQVFFDLPNSNSSAWQSVRDQAAVSPYIAIADESTYGGLGYYQTVLIAPSYSGSSWHASWTFPRFPAPSYKAVPQHDVYYPSYPSYSGHAPDPMSPFQRSLIEYPSYELPIYPLQRFGNLGGYYSGFSH